MIQRKQSLWLLIAALLCAGTFVFDFYRYDIMENGSLVSHALRVPDHYPSLLVAVVMTLLPLITIFMYANRKRQLRMSAAAILAIASFTTLSLNRVTNLDKLVPAPTNGSYWIGAVLPVVALIFIIMAMLGIRRDDKLVKSVDRLR